MKTVKYSGYGLSPGKTEGFTLIEVIVSIAIVSIISVALLQMFALSARSNNKAYIMDKANALCTETAERFKADPGFPAASGSGFNPVLSGSGIVYSKYLDRNFETTAGPAPASSSVYSLNIEITTSPAAITKTYYYPEAAYSYVLTGDTNMVLDQTGSDLTVSAAYGPENAVVPGRIIYTGGTAASPSGAASRSAMIPIHLNCSSLTAPSNVTVDFRNKADTVENEDGKKYRVVADIYLLDVPPGVTVTVNAAEGVVARQEMPVGSEGSENIMYTTGIKITKLSDDTVLAENTVEKYWVK